MKNQIRLKVNIKGRVQGVFFRAYTQEKAIDLGLKGYVKNMPDGSVEVLLQGRQEQIDQMLEWCWQGSPMSSVSDVVTIPADNAEDYAKFTITY